jgi:hypothetical protein
MFRHTFKVATRPVYYPLKRLLNLDYFDVQKLSFQKYGLVDENSQKREVFKAPWFESKQTY